jgi:L-ascorbate metabolism protein UlaG (beta-lactamase superfamily)
MEPRITKFGHACVRIEYDGVVLVVDPGGWTQPEAVAGADAIVITHEHPDHYFPDHLRAAGAPIYTIGAVAARIEADAPDLLDAVQVVTPGQTLDLGMPVEVVGELHAVIHPELPRFDNSGYLIQAGGTSIYHPGDALTPPPRPVEVLCLPVSAPWLKASEAVDFAREVGAPRNLAIHDRVYSEAGLGIIDGHMARFLPPAGQSFVRIADGSDL